MTQTPSRELDRVLHPTHPAYLAALWDMAGTIFLIKNGTVRVGRSSTEKWICDLFAAAFGGGVLISRKAGTRRNGQLRKSPVYQWVAYTVAAKAMQDACGPYIRTRHLAPWLKKVGTPPVIPPAGPVAGYVSQTENACGRYV